MFAYQSIIVRTRAPTGAWARAGRLTGPTTPPRVMSRALTDHVRLHADRACGTMQFVAKKSQKYRSQNYRIMCEVERIDLLETAGVADGLAFLVLAPEWRGGRMAVVALRDGNRLSRLSVSMQLEKHGYEGHGSGRKEGMSGKRRRVKR